jgi:hypothetical protein
MTIDERLEALTKTVELMASLQRDREATLDKHLANVDKQLAVLTERSIVFMDTMNRVGRILAAHDHTLDEHERRLDKLTG